MSPPHIKSKAFFGLRTNIKGNAHFVTDSEILYPAGGVLVLHDHDKKVQRYIQIPEDRKTIQSIIIAPNKKYIALSEKINKEKQKPTISIYNLETLQHEKTLNIPFEGITCTEFSAIDFTCDSKYLVAITGEPDWMLYYYNWENGKIESQTKAQNPNGQGFVTQVNCNPTDPSVIVISGRQTFRLMNVSETVWRQWGWTKAENLFITCCIWLTSDRVMFGTKTGMLMTVENGELKDNHSCKGRDVVEIDYKKTEEKRMETIPQTKDQVPESSTDTNENNEIRCLSVFAKGFAYSSRSGLVYMFEKESRHKWIRRNIFKVMDPPFRVGEEEYIDLNVIQYISINPNQDMLMITTLKSQLYYVKLFEEHINQVPELAFKELGEVLHNGKINGLAMCSWKPIFMTSGKDDRTVRLWNYETEEIELIKVYHGDIYSISLHPTGLFALIGFLDKLRYMVILIDDILQLREFSIRNCEACRFSNNGNLFAAVNGSAIQIFSTISFQNIFNLKGHQALIRGISWAGTDTKLVSCGSDGAIYEWCLTTGNRTSEVIIKNNDFTSCAVNSDGKSAYIVGIDGEVKEVQNNTIIRNLKIIGIKLDNIILARSDFMLFVTGGKGNVVSIQFPLLDKAVFSEFHMHNTSVTAIALSYNDQTLITVAEDATICIWKITNTEGKTVVMSKDFQYSEEIMINKNDLQRKIKNITELSKNINEMNTEHAYTMRQINVLHMEKLQDVHSKYTNTIIGLENKIENMEIQYTHQIDSMNNDTMKLQSNHEKIIESMEAEFNNQRIEEYDKYQILVDKTEAMRKHYEEKIDILNKNKEIELNEIKEDLNMKMIEKNHIINELEEINKNEAVKHEYIKQAIEDDADREIVELKTDYEKELKEEKDLFVRLKAQSELLKIKITASQKEVDDNKFQIQELQNEIKEYQKSMQALRLDIDNLKLEINKRDATINDKEKLMSNLKLKKEENEKHIFILNYKVEDLEKQMAPKDESINKFQNQIQEMDTEKKEICSQNETLSLEVEKCKEKINGLQQVLNTELEKNYNIRYSYKNLQNKLCQLHSVILEPAKLKATVKEIIKYKDRSDDEIRELGDSPDVDAKMSEIERLEIKNSSLIRKLNFYKNSCKRNVLKKIEENMMLLEEIDSLKNELKLVSVDTKRMKMLLGLSPAHVTPSRARELIHKACENVDKIKEELEEMKEKDSMIKSLELHVKQMDSEEGVEMK